MMARAIVGSLCAGEREGGDVLGSGAFLTVPLYSFCRRCGGSDKRNEHMCARRFS